MQTYRRLNSRILNVDLRRYLLELIIIVGSNIFRYLDYLIRTSDLKLRTHLLSNFKQFRNTILYSSVTIGYHGFSYFIKMQNREK